MNNEFDRLIFQTSCLEENHSNRRTRASAAKMPNPSRIRQERRNKLVVINFYKFNSFSNVSLVTNVVVMSERKISFNHLSVSGFILQSMCVCFLQKVARPVFKCRHDLCSVAYRFNSCSLKFTILTLGPPIVRLLVTYLAVFNLCDIKDRKRMTSGGI